MNIQIPENLSFLPILRRANGSRIAATLAIMLTFLASGLVPEVRAAPPAYAVTYIGDLIANVQSGSATAVNTSGDSVGWISYDSSWEHTPFLYLNEGAVVLLPRPAWAVTARALDLSERRTDGTIDVVGWAANSIYSGDLAVRWRVTLASQAVDMTELGVLDGYQQSHARAVNVRGDIVGHSTSFMGYSGPATLFADSGPVRIGFNWNQGAADITADRWVLVNDNYTAQRISLDTAEEIDIGVPPGRLYTSRGAGINARYQVAVTASTGDTDPRGQYIKQVWRYSDVGVWEYLFGGSSSVDHALGINLSGDVIGRFVFGTSYYDVIYVDAMAQTYIIEDLLVDADRGIDITVAAINDAGQLAAAGPGGPVLLTPAGDTPPPTAPVDLTATLLPETTTYPNGLIRVTWTNTSNLTKSNEVQRMPGPNGEAGFTDITLSGNGTDGIYSPLDLSTTYTYRVRACGVAGCSDWSATASATTRSMPTDNVPPTVSIVTPTDGAQVSGNVTVEVEASDNRGVASLLVAVNPFKGSPTVCIVADSPTASCTWNTKKLDAGFYTLTATAADAIGNRTSASITVELLTKPKGGGGGKGRPGK